MKRLAVFLLLTLASVHSNRAQATDLVFDLDWTLIYSTREAAATADPKGVVRYGSEIYRFSEDAARVLLFLHRLPGVRVSFFSGGERERNEFVLGKLYEEINRLSGTGDETHRLQPYRIGSAQDLHVISTDTSKHFAERNKKPLKKLIPDIDLQDAVLIDDSDFADPGEERNLLRLVQTFDDIPSYASPEWRTAGLQETPTSRDDWKLERKKIVWVLGVVTQARELAARTSISFTEAVVRLTRNPQGGTLGRTAPSYAAQVTRGLKLLRTQISPCDRLLK